ncbi:MAG TPA: helix-turn-helix domain-containing protein [Acidimicrobiales bacterium]|nr:helix-turn-helix domain-containing protein [Acidimicrobiales bacterium]
MTESFGRRVAKLRAGLGWTQARLAERIAVSRVALSHVESGLTTPSERTVTLLAGVFGVEPHELAGGTDYPRAKAERLPLVAARHTEAAHQAAVLAALVDLAGRLPEPHRSRVAAELVADWHPRLRGLLRQVEDGDERRRLRAALRGLSPPAGGPAATDPPA